MSHVEETELGLNTQRGGCQAGAGSWDTEAAAVGRYQGRHSPPEGGEVL